VPRSPKKAASRFTHGKSEIWERAPLARKIASEKRRLGARLRSLREARGWTQAEAAETIGVHHNHVVRMESGRANPTVATLIAIGDGYGVTLLELFGG